MYIICLISFVLLLYGISMYKYYIHFFRKLNPKKNDDYSKHEQRHYEDLENEMMWVII